MNDKLTFKGSPMAKPRMTRADTWKKRPIVERYWAFKDLITLQAAKQGFKLADCYRVVFYMEMPKSWSQKKKKEMNGKFHRQRPDIDNMIKSINDSLLQEDSGVFYVVAIKKWSEKPGISIENYPESLDF
jgi:Holliday junction resolvase RusA-like endonuclease